MNTIKSLFFLFCLVISNVAAAVTIEGTYTSLGNEYTVTITLANTESGDVVGTYTSPHTPVGSFSDTGTLGRFSWVYNNFQQRDGVAPFLISFEGRKRPDDRSYAIRESWNGVYMADNSIFASGTRAYVHSNGTVNVIPLGTLLFTRR